MGVNLTPDLVNRYLTTGPRYTSYPTAPEWRSEFSADDYASGLREIAKDRSEISLYIHLPFCQNLCYYCGCNVVINKSPRPDKADQYLEHLIQEMQIVRQYFQTKPIVKQLHFGGGTPNFLSLDQFQRLFDALNLLFDLSQSDEIAMEIDPRHSNDSDIKAYKVWGVNRISMGIQDFDPDVQQAINRIQPFEQVLEVTQAIRQAGILSINMDLIYGLPRQNPTGFSETLSQIHQLSPDRIALYSYAHLPDLRSHQTLIDPTELPHPKEKIELFLLAFNRLQSFDYLAIAMDHFAKRDDALAQAYINQTLYRNFMGYTTRPANEFIGFGITAISFVRNRFSQNLKSIPDYYTAIQANQLPISRGLVLSEDDKVRQWVIQELICHFQVDFASFKARFGVDFHDYFSDDSDHIQKCVDEKLINQTPSAMIVTDLGRFFVRNICMGFDQYLKKGRSRQFSSTV